MRVLTAAVTGSASAESGGAFTCMKNGHQRYWFPLMFFLFFDPSLRCLPLPMGIAGALVCGGRRAGSSHSAKVALLPTDFGEAQVFRRPCAWIFVLFAGLALVKKLYLFAARFAWKERQFWPSRTRCHCRARHAFERRRLRLTQLMIRIVSPS